MPESHRSSRNARTWYDAAADRQVALIRCSLCGRQAHYLLEDLALVCGLRALAHVLPFPCSTCATAEYMRVTLTIPRADEALTHKVRRPVRQVTRWIWQTVPLTNRRCTRCCAAGGRMCRAVRASASASASASADPEIHVSAFRLS